MISRLMARKVSRVLLSGVESLLAANALHARVLSSAVSVDAGQWFCAASHGVLDVELL